MKEFWLQVGALVVVILISFWITFTPGLMGSIIGKPSLNITVGNQPGSNGSTTTTTNNQTRQIKIVNSTGDRVKATIDVEIADTQSKRSKGLGGRSTLAEDLGMLFIFNSPSKPEFWMKGMLIPIDIIWIRGDEVVDLYTNAKPVTSGIPDSQIPKISPLVEVDKVLEVNSGFVSDYGIKIGDKYEVIQ